MVREEPFFDDAGMRDALHFGLDRIADAVLSANKFFVPEEASGVLADVFAESDLVISKGTGNFEALKGGAGGKTTIFLLKAKCKIISEQTGVDLGEFVVEVEK